MTITLEQLEREEDFVSVDGFEEYITSIDNIQLTILLAIFENVGTMIDVWTDIAPILKVARSKLIGQHLHMQRALSKEFNERKEMYGWEF